jgi:hypothetical protein
MNEECQEQVTASRLKASIQVFQYFGQAEHHPTVAKGPFSQPI